MFETRQTGWIIEELKTNVMEGLTSQEAASRLAEHGYNQFEEKKKKTKLQMFLSQLKDPLIYILIVAAIISTILREYGDSIIILAVVLLNAVIGLAQE